MSQNVTLWAIISAAQSRRAGIEALASASDRRDRQKDIHEPLKGHATHGRSRWDNTVLVGETASGNVTVQAVSVNDGTTARSR
jgi:hypothetical protein